MFPLSLPTLVLVLEGTVLICGFDTYKVVVLPVPILLGCIPFLDVDAVEDNIGGAFDLVVEREFMGTVVLILVLLSSLVLGTKGEGTLEDP